MKKYILALAAVAGMAFNMTAQEDGPNRMLVFDNNDQYKGFKLENVKTVEFATVEGEIAANLELLSSSMTSLKVNAIRTPGCSSFMATVIPGVIARQIESMPQSAGSYMEYYKAGTYTEDFKPGEVNGLELDYGTEYAFVSLGIDMYGVYGDFRAVYFTTENAPVLGNPKVDVQVTGTGLTTLDLTFTPNSDVLSYTFCIFEEGQAKAQFEQFGPMFGFSNMGQMIQTFGGEQKYGALEYQYKQLEPNTDYELYVQPLDKNGNMAELQVFEMSTLKQGGSGPASVEILVGDYRLADWNGEMLPSQFFSFVPNDQTWSYRFAVYMAEQYDADPDACKETVASEPPVPNMANWFFFAPITTDYQIDPNTTVVAIAAAKNADGVWGEPTVLRHTTAAIAQPSGVKLSPAAKIASRMIPVPLGNRSGYGRVATSGINIVKL